MEVFWVIKDSKTNWVKSVTTVYLGEILAEAGHVYWNGGGVPTGWWKCQAHSGRNLMLMEFHHNGHGQHKRHMFELIDGTSVYKLLEKENPLYLDTIDTALTAPHRFWVKHSCTHRSTDTVYLQKFGINAD